MNYEKLSLHKPLDLPSHTFTTKEPSEEIEYLFNKVGGLNDYKRRSHNYVIDKTLKSRTLAYTVTTVEGHPVLGSLAWTRPMYNGIIRLCTRYCIDPDWSFLNFGKGTDGMRLDTMDHIIQQIEVCRELGHEDFFIGRNDKSRKGRRSKKIAKQISKYTGMNWQSSDREILCSKGIEDDQSWQYVIYNNRKDFDYESEFKK